LNGKLKRGLIAGGVVAALAGGGAALAGATGGSDDGEGTPVKGNALQHASAVALNETGGGKVTGSEIRDEEGFYEIEVTRDDGSQVDVHLDRNFNVIDASSDRAGGDEGAADEGAGG
jgi:hypothetical protein